MRFTTIVCFTLWGLAAFGQAPPGTPVAGDPVATVGGQPIYEGELTPLVEGQLRQLQYQEYLLRRKALDDLIDQRLVAAKAKEKGITAEELLRQLVDSNIPDPTDAQVEAFYFHQRNLSNVPFSKVKPQLVTALKQQSIDRARQAYFEQLRKSSDVAVMLQPPRVHVAEDLTRLLGSREAQVTIVEFADFKCPYCRDVESSLHKLLSKYDGQVRLSFRDFPLDEIHPGASRAAEAARCANEQGKFWAYHDVLFNQPGRFGDEVLKEDARAAGLEPKAFAACLQDNRFKPQIENDVKDALQAGVSGTPAFFVNGVFLNGLQSLEAFERIIDQELAAVKKTDENSNAGKTEQGGLTSGKR